MGLPDRVAELLERPTASVWVGGEVASDAVTFDNLNIEAHKVAWPWLRKLSPKRFGYRRAAQLPDAVQILLDWDESK